MATGITSVKSLHAYLGKAMQLEHATIPPYLSALYSIKPGTNSDAYHVMRVAVIEEMLHLTIAANVLNAVGGSPNPSDPDFVPDYPAYLPDGENDFQVDRQRFSPECIDNFLEIERPREAPGEGSRLVRRQDNGVVRLGAAPEDPEMQFFSIGEFYRAIGHGLCELHGELGDALFCGDPARQVTDEYYYSGGGSVVVVTDLDSALAGLQLIAGQGEGHGGRIYDRERELAHYYRFEQLKLGRYYQPDDSAGAPTGPKLAVDWDASFPIAKNARTDHFAGCPELIAASDEFNRSYADFLATLTRAFNGEPALLLEAVVDMFALRDQMTRLVHNPVPGLDANAAPTFEVARAAAKS